MKNRHLFDLRGCGPVVVGLSGGRTSAYMLWLVLTASDGLPDNVLVMFTDTGEELPETYAFLDAIEKRWGITILRLARPNGQPLTAYAQYSAAISIPLEELTPLDFLLEDYRVGCEVRGVSFNVFGGKSNWCSIESKHRTMERMALQLFGEDVASPKPVRVSRKANHAQAILTELYAEAMRRAFEGESALQTQKQADFTFLSGIRADEPKRLGTTTEVRPVYPVGGEPWFVTADKAEPVGRVRYDVERPLADAGIVSADVMDFWDSQPFDLEIPSSLGNCFGCPWKNKARLKMMELAKPGLLQKWAMREDYFSAATQRVQRFKRDRGGRYTTLIADAHKIRDAAGPEAIARLLSGADDALRRRYNLDEVQEPLACFCTD